MPAGIRGEDYRPRPRPHGGSSRARQAGQPVLTIALIVGLAAAVLYLGKQVIDTKAENSQLRSVVLSLKRKLSRRL
jgi:hypothetical protein